MFQIFSDIGAEGGEALALTENTGWGNLGTEAGKRKENEG
jgi:hypothetical protein